MLSFREVVGGARRRGRADGEGRVHPPGRIPGRQASRRRGRIGPWFRLWGAGRRDERRRGDRPCETSTRSGVALDCGHAINRLAVAGQIEALCGWAWDRPCARNALPRRSRRAWQFPRLPDADHRGISRHRDIHLSKAAIPTDLRRQGERRRARRLPPTLVSAIGAVGVDPTIPDHDRPRARRRSAARKGRRRRPPHRNEEVASWRRACRYPGLQPASIEEAVALASAPDARYIAGGTDLLVNMRRGIAQPRRLIDLTASGRLKDDCDRCEGRRHRRGRHSSRLVDSDEIGRLFPPVAQRPADRRAGPSQRGDARRQSLSRHALHLLQPERMVAMAGASRTAATHAMSRRAANAAMQRSAATCACAARLGAQVEIAPVRRASPPFALAGLYVEDGRAHRARARLRLLDWSIFPSRRRSRLTRR